MRVGALAADGVSNTEIAQRLGVGRIQVGRWRERFAEGGLTAITTDLPRSGCKPRIDAAEIVRLTTQTMPAAATHWSTRSLAAQVGKRHQRAAHLASPWPQAASSRDVQGFTRP